MAKKIWILTGILIAAIIALLAVGSMRMPQVEDSAAAPTVAGIKVGGAFTLVDHNGRTVTEKDYADKFKLMFFGFTYCPSVCPTELQKIADALADLGPLADRLVPLFISVDPERDTPAIMKEYVGKFDSRIIGLTGSRAQIDAMLRTYKIYASKQPIEGTDDYTMDHSSFLYLMNKENELVQLYRPQQKAGEIATQLKKHLAP